MTPSKHRRLLAITLRRSLRTSPEAVSATIRIDTIVHVSLTQLPCFSPSSGSSTLAPARGRRSSFWSTSSTLQSRPRTRTTSVCHTTLFFASQLTGPTSYLDIVKHADVTSARVKTPPRLLHCCFISYWSISWAKRNAICPGTDTERRENHTFMVTKRVG